MAIPANYFLPPVLSGLEGLTELALDLRWSWNHATDKLWHKIAPGLWDRTNNPWLVLQTVASSRLETLAKDSSFRELLEGILAERNEVRDRDTWFQRANPNSPLKVAFFCEEAERQIQTIIDWGRYAEVLEYDDSSATFFLKSVTSLPIKLPLFTS